MAEFVIACPSCGEDITVDTDWAGMEVACPSCSNPFIVPDIEETEADSEAPQEDAQPEQPEQPEQPAQPEQQFQLPPGFDPSIFDYKPPQKPTTKSIVGASLTLGSFFFYFIFSYLYINLFGLALALAGMYVSYGVLDTLKDKKGLSKETIRNTKICSWCALLLALIVPILSVWRVNDANNNTPPEEKTFMGFIYAAMGLEDPEAEGSAFQPPVDPAQGMPGHPPMPSAPAAPAQPPQPAS